MADPSTYFKRVMEFPGIVRRPEDAKFEALAEIGARALVEKETPFQRILLVETPKNELNLMAMSFQIPAAPASQGQIPPPIA